MLTSAEKTTEVLILSDNVLKCLGVCWLPSSWKIVEQEQLTFSVEETNSKCSERVAAGPYQQRAVASPLRAVVFQYEGYSFSRRNCSNSAPKFPRKLVPLRTGCTARLLALFCRTFSTTCLRCSAEHSAQLDLLFLLPQQELKPCLTKFLSQTKRLDLWQFVRTSCSPFYIVTLYEIRVKLLFMKLLIKNICKNIPTSIK